MVENRNLMMTSNDGIKWVLAKYINTNKCLTLNEEIKCFKYIVPYKKFKMSSDLKNNIENSIV